MKKIFTLILFWAALCSTVMADNITVDGTQRNYLVYVPNNLGENRPLFISCHGMNQDAAYMRDVQMVMGAVADSAKFVIVFPNGIDKAWDISGNRDINFVLALIDKMVQQYKIDRNRVYLSGFSMGGMFTYHAMNKIADKIAAFAPISGYPLWGSEANSSRPIPIMHTQGTADDVCSPDGVPGVIAKWVARNGCSSTPTVTTHYRGTNHAKLTVWGGGQEGVEVRLMELEGKGHWVSNDGFLTGDEIWRFCRKYSLNKTAPYVSVTSPTAGLSYTVFAENSEALFPDITVKANANDPNGQVVRVDFYDGTQLVGTDTEAPYEMTFTGLEAGKHTLKAVATDNDNETGSASVDVTLRAPQSLLLSSVFNEDNALPVGWMTYDGVERRKGYANGFSSGCRVLKFTGETRGLDYGLYVRNVNGNARQGWAKYGLDGSGTTLTLMPGRYLLKYKICNWNQPKFSPVDIVVEPRDGGEPVITKNFKPNVNIGNDRTNSFGTLAQRMLSFDIEEAGEYVLAFYTADAPYADLILGYLTISASSYVPTGISAPMLRAMTDSHFDKQMYNLLGQRMANSQKSKGIYIINGRKYRQ